MQLGSLLILISLQHALLVIGGIENSNQVCSKRKCSNRNTSSQNFDESNTNQRKKRKPKIKSPITGYKPIKMTYSTKWFNRSRIKDHGRKYFGIILKAIYYDNPLHIHYIRFIAGDS